MIAFKDRPSFRVGDFYLSRGRNYDGYGWLWNLCVGGFIVKSGHGDSRQLVENACIRALDKLVAPVIKAKEVE